MATTTPRTKRAAPAAAAPAPPPERTAAPARHATAATATATTRAKTPKTPTRRGPRRSPASKPGTGTAFDLEGLRTALKKSIASHHATADLTDIDRAFDLAVDAHQGQTRATGEPYVTHPIASAQILADLGIDPIAIEAALLHDVPEDTEYSLTDIEDRFSAEVAHLVDGVTKLSRFSTHSHEQQQAENIRKMLLAMAEDIRVVLIKLADRLHNMRTLRRCRPRSSSASRARPWRSTRRSRSGSGSGRSSGSSRTSRSRCSSPSASASSPSSSTPAARVASRTSIARSPSLSPSCEAAGITADLEGRPKHIYSIWKKMQRKGAEFGEIYDVYAIRVLVDEVRDCYAALGVVHSCGARSLASSTTTSPCPRTTSTSRCTPR